MTPTRECIERARLGIRGAEPFSAEMGASSAAPRRDSVSFTRVGARSTNSVGSADGTLPAYYRATMSKRLDYDATTTATLLVLEADAAFPLVAANYGNPANTAIVVQQPGESPQSLRRRIAYEGRELELMGTKPETVVLVVNGRNRALGQHRRQIARALIDQLGSANGTLILVANGASPSLRQELMTLVGTLIEEDGVKHSIAIDFAAQRMAALRSAHAPLLSRAPRPVQADCAVAC